MTSLCAKNTDDRSASIASPLKRIALLEPEAYAERNDAIRQLATDSGTDSWHGTSIEINPRDGEFDAIVVPQSFRPLDRTYVLRCPPSRTLLAMQEPPDILSPPWGFTRQFHCVLSQDSRLRAPVRRNCYSGHHWFVEIPFREAQTRTNWPKCKLISAVTSNKRNTAGHQRRLKLLGALRSHFGDQFDWFGRGVRNLGSKAEGTVDYKYHIVLENGCWPNYWTEKLSDAYVANCYPFYWGAPNILEYFEQDSLCLIDIDDVPGTIKAIETAVNADRYSESQFALARARQRVLSVYHPYSLYIETLATLPRTPVAEVVIRPHNSFTFSWSERMGYRCASYWQRAREFARLNRTCA